MYLDDTLWVLDGATNTILTKVPVGKTPLEVAVNPATNTDYVANYGDNTISALDGTTARVLATIPFGRQPRGQPALLIAPSPPRQPRSCRPGGCRGVGAVVAQDIHVLPDWSPPLTNDPAC